MFSIRTSATGGAAERGEVLFQQGGPARDFFVVLEGEVELIEPSAGTPRVLGARQPSAIIGELNLLTEEAVYLSAVVRKPGSVLAIPADDPRAIVTNDPGFSDFLLRAFLVAASLPGVFAVGDVRSGANRRTESAVGEGSMAVQLCHAYLAETRGA